MSRYSRCIAVPAVLLAALAVATTSATALPHGEAGQLQDKREVKVGDAQLLEEATRMLGAKVVMNGKTKPSGGGGGAVATLGDDRSSSAGGSSSGEHGKEGEGSSNKEGDNKHPKNCLSKEACHKKKIICGKECTLSAHSKCAAKCSKSCVPTCS